MPGGRRGQSRRQFVQATGGTLAAVTGIGTASGRDAQVEDKETEEPRPDYDGWLSTAGNYDGTTVDRRGDSEVTVRVGAAGNEGPNAFDPPAVHVDAGATVFFEWTGESTHNVVAADGAWRSGEPVGEAGTHYHRTFEAGGIHRYHCEPHGPAGMRGAIVVGDDYDRAGETEAPGVVEPAYDGWFRNVDNYDGETVDRRTQEVTTVTVGAEGNGGPNAFEPPAILVDRGTTVEFEWTGEGTHSVVAEDGDWESGDPVGDAGVNFERAFEAVGVHRYYCAPHLGLGMKGAVVVSDERSPSGRDATTDASGPGFGIASALLGLAGGWHVLGRSDDDNHRA